MFPITANDLMLLILAQQESKQGLTFEECVYNAVELGMQRCPDEWRADVYAFIVEHEPTPERMGEILHVCEEALKLVESNHG